MARSRKKTPIIPNTCANSEKEDKRNANRKLRRKVKADLHKAQVTEIIEEIELPELREVSNVWSFAKDGKSFYKQDVSGSDGKHYRK